MRKQNRLLYDFYFKQANAKTFSILVILGIIGGSFLQKYAEPKTTWNDVWYECGKTLAGIIIYSLVVLIYLYISSFSTKRQNMFKLEVLTFTVSPFKWVYLMSTKRLSKKYDSFDFVRQNINPRLITGLRLDESLAEPEIMSFLAKEKLFRESSDYQTLSDKEKTIYVMTFFQDFIKVSVENGVYHNVTATKKEISRYNYYYSIKDSIKRKLETNFTINFNTIEHNGIYTYLLLMSENYLKFKNSDVVEEQVNDLLSSEIANQKNSLENLESAKKQFNKRLVE